MIVNLSVDCDGIVLRPDFDYNTEEYGGAILMGYANESAGAPVVLANITTTGTVGDAGHHTTHNTAGMVARSDGPQSTSASDGLIMVSCRNEANVYTTRNSSMKMGGLVGYLLSGGALRNCENECTLVTNRVLVANEDEGIGGFVGNVGAGRGLLNIYGGTSNTVIQMPAGTTGYGSITGWMRNGSIYDDCKVVGDLKTMPQNGSESGDSFVGVAADGGYYRLLNYGESPELNTDTVYKAFTTATKNFASATSGDYVIIDTSLVKPTIQFNGVAASEEVVSGSVIKFYAA